MQHDLIMLWGKQAWYRSGYVFLTHCQWAVNRATAIKNLKAYLQGLSTTTRKAELVVDAPMSIM